MSERRNQRGTRKAASSRSRKGEKKGPAPEAGYHMDKLLLELLQKYGTMENAMSYVAEETDYSKETVNRWRQGYYPQASESIVAILKIASQKAGLSRKWGEEYLSYVPHTSKIEEMLDVFWPPQNINSFESTITNILPSREQVERFLGREREMEMICESLSSSWLATILLGLRGIGKTTLAREVAYACLGQARDAAVRFHWPHFRYVVWCSDLGSQLRLNDILDEIALCMGHPSVTNEESLSIKKHLIYRLLAKTSLLLIVDNFETVNDPQIGEFIAKLPSGEKPGVKVILTSRLDAGEQMEVFERYPPARVRLERFRNNEALAFIKQHIELKLKGSDNDEKRRWTALLKADKAHLISLIEVVEGNPKVLELALSHMVESNVKIETLVNDLYIAGKEAEDIIDYFFEHAWEPLSKSHQEIAPQFRKLWMVVALFPAPVTEDALKAASGLQGLYFRNALRYLRSWSLLQLVEDINGKTRYRAHPMVAAFGLARLREAAEFEQYARKHWVDWYKLFLEQHDTNDWPAFPRIDADRENIFTVVEWALYHKFSDAPDLVNLIWRYLYIRGDWGRWRKYTQLALEQAAQRNDIVQRAYMTCALGWLYVESYTEPEALLEMFLDLEEELIQWHRTKLLLDTDLLNYTGQAYLRWDNLEKAQEYEERFLEMAEQYEDWQGYITAGYYLALIEFKKGLFKEAEAYNKELIQKANQLGWRRGEAYNIYRLARALIAQHKIDEAEAWLKKVEVLEAEGGEPLLRASLNYCRAMISNAQGDRISAIGWGNLAKEQYARLGALWDISDLEKLLNELNKKP